MIGRKMIALSDAELDRLLNWFAGSHSTGIPDEDELDSDLANKLAAARRRETP